MKTGYSRDELISLAERSSVPQSKWRNRDTADAQMKAGVALMLLRAGCEFAVQIDGPTATDEDTVWLDITYRGFSYFDGCYEDDCKETELFYLPTEKRLAEANGGDWY